MNPYWDDVREYVHRGTVEWFGHRVDRNDYVRRYAWTVTDPPTVDFVARWCGPRVVDVMAGTGYWAHLLSEGGADVVALDANPPGSRNPWCATVRWHPSIALGDCEASARANPDRTMLLAWPPYGEDAGARAVRAYSGPRIVYVGEDWGGCCGDDDMWEALGPWRRVAEHKPVQWRGLRDWVTVFERPETAGSREGAG